MNEFEELRKKYNIKLPGKGYLFVKRVMDIVCSAFALIVLSPILLITALAIKLESPGPVIFVQKRVAAFPSFCRADPHRYVQSGHRKRYCL